MACMGDLADAEADLLELLERVTSFEIDGDNMVLMDANGDVLAELVAVYFQ